MKTAGVIGWPVSHSLSPKLHRYWLKKYGIEGEYRALAAEARELEQTIASIKEMGWRGCNITIPHKEAVLPLLDGVDEAAKAIGAVNTVVIKDGILHGSNSDAYGFAENIRGSLSGTAKAVVLGAGGAARAVCYALIDMGFTQVIVLNRTFERAQALTALGQGKITAAPWDKRSLFLESADVLVNTTSLGLEDQPPLDMDLSALPPSALVTDIVYKPLLTPLLEQAKDRGNPVVDGLGMLLHQAAPGFEAWFGMRPEVTDELRKYVLLPSPSPLKGEGASS